MSKFKAVLTKVAGGLKSGGAWVLRRGPLIASGLTGLSLVFPQFAGVLKGAAGILAAQSGGAVDQQLVEAIGLIVNGVILTIGAVRKTITIAKPMLNPEQPK